VRDEVEALWWLIQDSERRGLFVAGAIVLLGLVVFGAYYYFAKLPERMADDYRGRAQPAAERITDSMDEVYKGFDEYLDETTFPLRRLRNAADYDEFKRRLLPIMDDTRAALQRSQTAVNAAQLTIEQTQADLGNVPSAPLLGGSGSIEEAEDAVSVAREYLEASATFLADFQRFIDYEQRSLTIERRYLAQEPESNSLESADLATVHDAVQSDLKEAQRTRRALLRLDPPPDAEKLDELQVEAANIRVDFYDDFLAGIENLNQAQIYYAARDYFIAAIRINSQQMRALQAFAANSHLQDATIGLSGMADELEDTIAALGSGSVDQSEPDRSRKRPTPPPPAGGGGDEGASEKVSVTS